MQAVCLCVINLRPTGDKFDETWSDAQKMLSNSRLLELLKGYPKDKITEKAADDIFYDAGDYIVPFGCAAEW